jgi:Zn-dependent protease with chaperone function
MPIAASFALILVFILPAFILYEPPESGETVSLKLFAVICLAVFGIVAALFRVFGSWWQTRRLIAEWNMSAIPIELDSVSLPVFKLRHPFPVFAVVGVVKPRLFIAEQLLDVLEPSEIRAVLRHEFGHIAAWDNLKRLAMKMSGDILVVPIGRSLDRNWSETSERAADEYAVEHGEGPFAIIKQIGAQHVTAIELANVVGFNLVERKQRSTAAAFDCRGITAFVRHEMLKRSQKKGTQASLFLSH